MNPNVTSKYSDSHTLASHIRFLSKRQSLSSHFLPIPLSQLVDAEYFLRALSSESPLVRSSALEACVFLDHALKKIVAEVLAQAAKSSLRPNLWLVAAWSVCVPKSAALVLKTTLAKERKLHGSLLRALLEGAQRESLHHGSTALLDVLFDWAMKVRSEEFLKAALSLGNDAEFQQILKARLPILLKIIGNGSDAHEDLLFLFERLSGGCKFANYLYRNAIAGWECIAQMTPSLPYFVELKRAWEVGDFKSLASVLLGAQAPTSEWGPLWEVCCAFAQKQNKDKMKAGASILFGIHFLNHIELEGCSLKELSERGVLESAWPGLLMQIARAKSANSSGDLLCELETLWMSSKDGEHFESDNLLILSLHCFDKKLAPLVASAIVKQDFEIDKNVRESFFKCCATVSPDLESELLARIDPKLTLTNSTLCELLAVVGGPKTVEWICQHIEVLLASRGPHDDLFLLTAVPCERYIPSLENEARRGDPTVIRTLFLLGLHWPRSEMWLEQIAINAGRLDERQLQFCNFQNQSKPTLPNSVFLDLECSSCAEKATYEVHRILWDMNSPDCKNVSSFVVAEDLQCKMCGEFSLLKIASHNSFLLLGALLQSKTSKPSDRIVLPVNAGAEDDSIIGMLNTLEIHREAANNGGTVLDRNRLANCYRSFGWLSLAEREYIECTRAPKKPASAYYNLVAILQKKGRMTEAAAWADEALVHAEEWINDSGGVDVFDYKNLFHSVKKGTVFKVQSLVNHALSAAH